MVVNIKNYAWAVDVIIAKMYPAGDDMRLTAMITRYARMKNINGVAVGCNPQFIAECNHCKAMYVIKPINAPLRVMTSTPMV